MQGKPGRNSGKVDTVDSSLCLIPRDQSVTITRYMFLFTHFYYNQLLAELWSECVLYNSVHYVKLITVRWYGDSWNVATFTYLRDSAYHL